MIRNHQIGIEIVRNDPKSPDRCTSLTNRFEPKPKSGSVSWQLGLEHFLSSTSMFKTAQTDRQVGDGTTLSSVIFFLLKRLLYVVGTQGVFRPGYKKTYS